MSDAAVTKLAEMAHAAMELAQFASYAEIVGALSHNRKPVREWCDKIFALNHELEAALDEAGVPMFPEDEAWTSEPERFRVFTSIKASGAST